MGYYTYYSLFVPSFDEGKISALRAKEIEAEIDKMNVFDDGELAWGLRCEAKWYDWESDMSLLSKRFPDVLFCLHGDGEDSDDKWDAYFLNGMRQLCPAVITYDSFDPTKLRPVKKSSDSNAYSYQQ